MRRLNRLRIAVERNRLIGRQMKLLLQIQASREPRKRGLLKRLARLQRLRQEAEETALLDKR